jgi:hypothetical protein
MNERIDELSRCASEGTLQQEARETHLSRFAQLRPRGQRSVCMLVLYFCDFFFSNLVSNPVVEELLSADVVD